MRRSMNGSRNGTSVIPKQAGGGSTMTRRSTSIDENGRAGRAALNNDDNQQGQAGPVTARLKMLEKKYSQLLEMQAKFSILDKWIQQQFNVKLFPSAVVNLEKFKDGNPEDAENPFYAVYILVQKVKFLEDKIKKLESRPFDDAPEPKPTSNYSSAHAFRNFKGGHPHGKGVKRTYVSSSPTTPKKPKLIPRPVATTSNYPFKPSVKILPKDSVALPVKKDNVAESVDAPKLPSPAKQSEDPPAKAEGKQAQVEQSKSDVGEEGKIDDDGATVTANTKDDTPNKPVTAEPTETEQDTTKDQAGKETSDDLAKSPGDKLTEEENESTEATSIVSSDIKQEQDFTESIMTDDLSAAEPQKSSGPSSLEGIPILEDATVPIDEAMDVESCQEDVDGELQIDQKPMISMDEEVGDVSGSEASVSSLASSSSKPRLSTRRQAAVAAATAASTSSSGKSTEEEKPVMYTARGRRHTVPRRYAEFTGHDNVVSILKSQQRAEKAALTAAGGAAGSSKGGKKQSSTPTKSQDMPPKIKKMVKAAKTPSPKKALTDDGDGESGQGKKKAAASNASADRPPCVDALLERVMAREVDSDGMVVLSEAYPNIYVNQQQLVAVIVRSNGKSTRLTRKMTTLVFEDSVLASASPFGTKYYKDRLPPEPLEAMVDFIAESGFEPHYSKKKIYMIVGQVCNEARAGRVSRKFMQPLEANPGPSSGGPQEPTSAEPPSEVSQPTE